jgi:putative nucleotidyltransferase with HDIG domain
MGYSRLYGVKKMQLQYIFFGLAFSLLGCVAFGIMFPLTGRHEFVFIASLFSLPFLISVGYAILKKNLLGVELVVFDITRFLVALVVLLVLNSLLFVVSKNTFLLPSLFSSSLSLVIVAILYFATPVEEKFTNVIRNVLLSRRLRYQKLLSDCSKAVTSILEVDKLMEYVIDSLSAALDAGKIAIFLKEKVEDDDYFRLYACRGVSEAGKPYLGDKKVIEWLEENKKPIIIDALWQELLESGNKELANFLGTYGAVLVIPLVYKEEVVGIITLDQKRADGAIFDIDDIEVLESLSGSIAVALENAKLYTQLNDAYMDITRSLSIAVETRDPFMVGHSENVTKYSLAIARKMDIRDMELIHIIQAAMLHDLGKIGVHDYILSKPGKLTDEEWVEMKVHTIKGAKILEPLPFMKEVARIVKYHHERWDGEGYPEGIKEDGIPLGARILAVADSFDAMVSPRVYRQSPQMRFSVERAVKELKDNRGGQFNSEIVDIFLGILEENPNIVSASSPLREAGKT